MKLKKVIIAATVDTLLSSIFLLFKLKIIKSEKMKTQRVKAEMSINDNFETLKLK